MIFVLITLGNEGLANASLPASAVLYESVDYTDHINYLQQEIASYKSNPTNCGKIYKLTGLEFNYPSTAFLRSKLLKNKLTSILGNHENTDIFIERLYEYLTNKNIVLIDEICTKNNIVYVTFTKRIGQYGHGLLSVAIWDLSFQKFTTSQPLPVFGNFTYFFEPEAIGNKHLFQIYYKKPGKYNWQSFLLDELSNRYVMIEKCDGSANYFDNEIKEFSRYFIFVCNPEYKPVSPKI